MERAGLAVASWAWRSMRVGDDVLILVGSGNNGGDGFVAGRHLQDWGARVHLYLCTARRPDLLLAETVEAGAQVVDSQDDADGSLLRQSLRSARLVIDAVLGTGRARPLEEPLRSIFEAVRAEKARRPHLTLLAVDIPSGVDADTGAADPACLTADVTVTLGEPKTGHFRFPGADHVGRLVAADVGIPCQTLAGPTPRLVTASWVREQLPPRSRRAHKGSFGRVLTVAGSDAYVGAAYLACMGAARAGAGYVTLVTLPSIRPILAAKLTEATHLSSARRRGGRLRLRGGPLAPLRTGRLRRPADRLRAGTERRARRPSCARRCCPPLPCRSPQSSTQMRSTPSPASRLGTNASEVRRSSRRIPASCPGSCSGPSQSSKRTDGAARMRPRNVGASWWS